MTGSHIASGNENMRQSEELRRLIEALPGQVLFLAGFHREMVNWMTQYQQICFLDYLRRDGRLFRYLDSGLKWEIREFTDGFGDATDRYYGFQVMRDDEWDRDFDRPRNPFTFESRPIRVGDSRHLTMIRRRGILATLQDHYDERCMEKKPILRLEHRNSYGDDPGAYDDDIVQIKSEQCITPLADFCYPPDAKVTIGYRMDGRVDIMVFAKEMPGSPVLHWIFPDPKNDGLPSAYRDFLWWL